MHPCETYCMPSTIEPLVGRDLRQKGGEQDQREGVGGRMEEEEECDIQGERIQDPDV